MSWLGLAPVPVRLRVMVFPVAAVNWPLVLKVRVPLPRTGVVPLLSGELTKKFQVVPVAFWLVRTVLMLRVTGLPRESKAVMVVWVLSPLAVVPGVAVKRRGLVPA